MSILSSHKQTIIIGNDGIVHYTSKGRVIREVFTLAWGESDFVNSLKKSIVDVGRNIPVQLIFDVAEQQYRKETIPPINPFDKRRVVKRKVRMVYPNHDVRAFLPLKQKPKEGKGAVYLFAALPSTQEVDMVVTAVLESNVTIAGMMLLPMEGTSIIKKLSQHYFKTKKDAAPKWTILIGHHKTGGIRQIVTRNGELALTRLTPVGQKYLNEPAHIPANEMIKEFSATLTYLARFGYTASDGLNLIVVSSPEVSSQFQEGALPVSNLKAVTVGEAVNDLKIGRIQSIHDDDYSADILHAAWVSKQYKHLMPLAMHRVDRLQKARLVARTCVVALFFLMFGLGAYAAYKYSEIQQYQVEIAEQKKQKLTLQKQYDEAASVFDVLQYDPEKTRVILSVFSALKNKSVDPNESFLAIKESLIGSMTLDRLQFEIENPDVESAHRSDGAETETVKITIGIEFPAPRDTALNVRETESFIARLKTRFPGRDVRGIKLPGDLSVDKTVQGVSQNAQQFGLASDIKKTGDVAEVIITGEAL